MENHINWTALGVFVFFFALVTVMGFAASRWQSGKSHKGDHLDEWGLGGRNFGTWITWFLVGGDFYTGYTVISVPTVSLHCLIRSSCIRSCLRSCPNFGKLRIVLDT